MDDNIRELMLFAILQHKHLMTEFGSNDWQDSELKRVVESNGGKLKASDKDDGAFELVSSSVWEVGRFSQEDKDRMTASFKMVVAINGGELEESK